jgi:ketosteroid isomerase-like protein
MNITEPNTTSTHPGPPPEDPTSVAAALYAALAERALDRAVVLLDPEVVLHVPGTHAQAGTHRGLDAVLACMAATTAATDDGETVDALELLTGPEHVAVRCRVTATRGAKRLDNSTIHLLRVRGGRVQEIHLHNFDGVAVDAFWS